ncbi:proline-rich protein 18-like [Seriola aureovittata]|uniref:proline-rich protein 18-like n=1 Tax=Seriola aureovittata TaxID=2871759 RepID=UPI0024BE62BA|nr:proline-rich protein 18-like [Seriola aureovittata]
MPFIPQVSIVRSVSGQTGKESGSSTAAAAKMRVPKEDKGNSVKERLTLNLKQLGKKGQPRSHLPTPKEVSGAELHLKRRDRLLPSSLTDSFPASSSDGSLSKPQQQQQQQRHAGRGSVRSEPEVETRTRHQEEARFTLTLTPEAVQLLRRRNSDWRQRSAARNAESAAGVSGSAADSRRRRENVSKRHQPATQRHNASTSRAADISSIVKISLLNEQHKYDDVEYEEEDYGVDERVVLKCTEWLRGLENTPVAAGNSLSKSASSVQSF